MIRAICIGGANLDRKIRARGPILPGTSNPADVFTTYGGVARNVAENLGRLGVMPALLTVVGDDPAGELLLTHCAAGGVYVSQVRRVPGERTGSYTAILNEGGDMLMAFADMDLYERLTVDRLLAAWPVIAQTEVVTADTNLPESTLHTLIERARSERFRLAVVSASVPKVRRLPHSLTGVDLLVLNRDEAEALTGITASTLDRVWAAAEALRERGCGRVVITLGQEGLVASDAGGRLALAAEPVQPVDVTGAGDALAAGLIYCWLRGEEDLGTACRFGLRLAALTVQTAHSVSCELEPRRADAWLEEARRGAQRPCG